MSLCKGYDFVSPCNYMFFRNAQRFQRNRWNSFLSFIYQYINRLRLCSLQVPCGVLHRWRPERRESPTRSRSWQNLRMNFWWMNSSTDRNGKSFPTGWNWATSKWKYGFRIGGWKRNAWWCANKLSPRTDDVWTWLWSAAHRDASDMWLRPVWMCKLPFTNYNVVFKPCPINSSDSNKCIRCMYIRMNQSMSKCAWPLGPGSCPPDNNKPSACLLLSKFQTYTWFLYCVWSPAPR